MAAPVQPAASPPARPPPPLPPPYHDTTLRLALALPPPRPFAGALPTRPRPLHARRPRAPVGIVASSAAAAFARVRSSPTGDTQPCTECGKRFPSWKALFGHMRCHPERQWRGITPPPHFRRAAVADQQFTVQERETATSLLMLAGARPGVGKGKKSILAPSSAKASCCSTSTPAPTTAPASPPRCDDDHKCSVRAQGFAAGQALGGHKRCHWDWERARVELMAVAATSSSCSALATSEAAATTLDLNLPPPGTMPLLRKGDEDGNGILNASLDLKLGY